MASKNKTVAKIIIKASAFPKSHGRYMWFIAKMKHLLVARNVSPENMGFVRKPAIKTGQELEKSFVLVLAGIELISAQYSEHSKQWKVVPKHC